MKMVKCNYWFAESLTWAKKLTYSRNFIDYRGSNSRSFIGSIYLSKNIKHLFSWGWSKDFDCSWYRK